MLNIGIIGGSGYTGGELMRLSLFHPEMNIELVTSRRLNGKKIHTVHKHLNQLIDLEFENLKPLQVIDRCDVVFVAVPHGTSMNIVPDLLANKKKSVKIIDLSADYRLNSKVFEKVYGRIHKDKRSVVYGIPELHKVAKEQFIANPGCYPTGAILAAAPLADADLIQLAVFDSKSGISGAGASESKVSHYPNLAENINAYKLTTHRHFAEISQELTKLSNINLNLSFTPHVIPSIRGILTTAHIFTNEDANLTMGDIKELYENFYKNKPFVRILDTIPNLSSVRGSNFCDIGFEIDEKNNRIVVVSAIDNLVKGASGQAIQNMNLMCGFDESLGLLHAGLLP